MPTTRTRIPNQDIMGAKGKQLRGKLILIGITGSPAAVESVELARELMRFGAEVIPIMTPASARLIHPNLLEWATGNSPVTELTGKIEHILYTHSTGRPADLYLIAPCTGNTIGKIASGIDDTPVTSTAAAAIGERIPLIIAPAMHDSMWSNPFVLENLKKLQRVGIEIVQPRLEEGKAKIASMETIIDAVIARMTKKDLGGMNILITAGPTLEYIDPIRIITNKSSGKMGIALAKTALRRGGKVTIVYGPAPTSPPIGAEVVNVETTEEMQKAVERQLRKRRYDLAILSAAVSDFAPTKKSTVKLPSKFSGHLELPLRATPKILDRVKQLSPYTFLVAFKAEHDLSERELASRGFQRLEESGADLIAVNDVAQDGAGFGKETNEVLLIDKARKVVKIGLSPKGDVAERILDEAVKRLQRQRTWRGRRKTISKFRVSRLPEEQPR